MKLLFAAAFAFTAYSQQLPTLASNGEVAAPIILIEDQAPKPEVKQPEIQTQEVKKQGQAELINISGEMIVGREEFNPTVFVPEQNVPEPTKIEEKKIESDQTRIGHNHGQVMPGQQQFNPDWSFYPPPPPPPPFPPARGQFNPGEFNPEREHQMRKKHKEMKDHKNKEFKHQNKQNKHEGKMEKRMRKEQERRDEQRRLENPLDYDSWEQHVERGHRKGKFHRKLWIPLFFVALFFTFIGFLLGKCIRKIRKNKCDKKRQNCQNISLTELENEIKNKEINLNKLKAEYQNKKSEQQSQAQMIRQEQMIYNPHQMQMIQRIQPQQLRGYPQSHPHYTYQNQIPIGRPI